MCDNRGWKGLSQRYYGLPHALEVLFARRGDLVVPNRSREDVVRLIRPSAQRY